MPRISSSLAAGFSAAALAVTLGCGTTLLPTPAAAAATCDRECLRGFLTIYLDALVARDPKRLPLATGARFTENGAEIPPGEGLWFGVQKLGGYRYDYLDPESGGAATHVNFVENGAPGLMALRLKVTNGKIVEIETVLNRNSRNAAQMVPTEDLWNQVAPPASRLTRAQLAAAAESYLRAVATSDGRAAPFDEETCVRLENGGVMAMTRNDQPTAPLPPASTQEPWLKVIRSTLGMGCSAQISTGVYSFITSYDNARFPVIDVERQIVFGHWNFRRRGDVKSFTYDGAVIPHMASTQFPNENLLGQAFKFRDGKIVRVQGVFYNANVYKIGTGWDKPKPKR